MGRLRDRRTRGPATIAIVVLLCVLAAGPVRAESLQGRVVEDHTGRPIMAANVRVAKIGQSILAAARGTDADGTFQALNLSAGEYRIEVSKPNYLPATLRLRLPLAATSGLRIRLVRLGVISGRVTDADGRPTRGSRVFVMLKPALGLPLQAFGNSYAVDDSGRYRIYNLPPGEYAVAVSSASFSDFSRSGLYYYPRNGQPRFFTFSGGEEYRDVNFTIVPGPLYHVSGKVVLPEGGGRAVLSLFLLGSAGAPLCHGVGRAGRQFSARGHPVGILWVGGLGALHRLQLARSGPRPRSGLWEDARRSHRGQRRGPHCRDRQRPVRLLHPSSGRIERAAVLDVPPVPNSLWYRLKRWALRRGAASK